MTNDNAGGAEVRVLLELLQATLPPDVWVETGAGQTLHIPLPGRGPGSGRWIELRPIALDPTDRAGAARGPGWEGRVWPEGEVEIGPSWEIASWTASWARKLV